MERQTAAKGERRSTERTTAKVKTNKIESMRINR